ncbi:BRCT domain-containing protein [Dioscorea alata]|uniref:BRCT domain-containing protein n=2 Tax=Dioscorea alata TaxID=55571 RepID=A0ACB7V8L2_DIOAL|nr:BRCT domain-containing protein [Dioscorea alata]KAH7669757.1 BRCT domain-containing protein [Dioscorea alata]
MSERSIKGSHEKRSSKFAKDVTPVKKKDNVLRHSKTYNEPMNGQTISKFSTMEEGNIAKSKKRKLNTGIKTCSQIKPSHSSNQSAADGPVKCAFCHSFKITDLTGLMQHYVGERLAEKHQPSQANSIHAHQKCVDWAPQVYYEGNKVVNLEAEVLRASKLKCGKCGKKGAALGCFLEKCKKSYHVPCAVQLRGCRWDCENYLVLCPSHTSLKLPCDDPGSTGMKIHTDQPSPGQMDSTTQNGKWILCGSALSEEEKELVDKFANFIGAVVRKTWDQIVTHVIASTDEKGACSRTIKVLMAILTGKWVLNINWVKASMEARKLVSEEPYEINLDIYGSSDGPKTGRIRLMKKFPKLFAGLSFHFSGYFSPSRQRDLETLISVAGGVILDKNDALVLDNSNSQLIYIVYNAEPPPGNFSWDPVEDVRKRCEDAEALAGRIHAQVITHTRLLDAIASSKF